MKGKYDDIRAIARRATERIIAGLAGTGAGPRARGSGTRAALVTASDVEAVPDGGKLALPRGVRITPLAREEAWRRGVQLVGGGSSAQMLTGGAGRVALGSDHGGFELKGEIAGMLVELGWRVLDLGTRDRNACDYPDFARAVAEAVAEGRAQFGIAVDGAGIGSCMAANKVPGVLAANCWNEAAARNAREHNHANVLTLGAGHLDRASAYAVLRAFLETSPGPGRHERRAGMIHAVGQRYSRARSALDALEVRS